MNRTLPPPSSHPAARWLKGALAALAGAALLVLGFFFALVALAVVAGIALVVLVRWWWLMRRLKRAAGPSRGSEAVVEGEYVVVERDTTGTDGPAKTPEGGPPRA